MIMDKAGESDDCDSVWVTTARNNLKKKEREKADREVVI